MATEDVVVVEDKDGPAVDEFAAALRTAADTIEQMGMTMEEAVAEVNKVVLQAGCSGAPGGAARVPAAEAAKPRIADPAVSGDAAREPQPVPHFGPRDAERLSKARDDFLSKLAELGGQGKGDQKGAAVQAEVEFEHPCNAEAEVWRRLVCFHGAAGPAVKVQAVHELDVEPAWRAPTRASWFAERTPRGGDVRRKVHRLNVPALPGQPRATIVSVQYLKGPRTVVAIGMAKNFSEFAVQWVATYGGRVPHGDSPVQEGRDGYPQVPGWRAGLLGPRAAPEASRD